LLQTIVRPLEMTGIIRMRRIHKSEGLLIVYSLLEGPVKKGVLHIQLMN
jgi:hypothetical protein